MQRISVGDILKGLFVASLGLVSGVAGKGIDVYGIDLTYIRAAVLVAIIVIIALAVAYIVDWKVQRSNNKILSAAHKQLLSSDSKVSAAVDKAIISLEEATNGVGLATDTVKGAAGLITKATVDLTNLRDTLIGQDWYFPYDRFMHREREICSEAMDINSSVKIVVISSTLKFDTDKTLLEVVNKNISGGAKYEYFVPKGMLKEERRNITSLPSVKQRPGSVTFHELNSEHDLLLFEYAVFDFCSLHEGNPEIFLSKFEAYMALDTDVPAINTPWMKLRDPARRLLLHKIDNLLGGDRILPARQ